MFHTQSIVLAALCCAAVVNCLPSVEGEIADNGNYTAEWDRHLPPSPFTNEQIQGWIDEIKQLTIDVRTKEGAIDGLMRMKRGTEQRDNSHWCCNKRDPGQIGPRQEVVKARVVQRTISQGGSYKCGFLGMRRCGSSRRAVVTLTEYYMSYEYPTIPAPEWTNGCPTEHIVCCNGYAFYPSLNNCLTFVQLENILAVVRENQEALFLLNSFLQGFDSY